MFDQNVFVKERFKLGRKYRPKTFDDIIGNKEIVRLFLQSTKRGSLPNIVIR